MKNDLIYDLGMHHGKDTEFYLKKGFRVIAVEANPDLVDRVSKKLSSYIEDKSLIILNNAVSDEKGTIDFFINLDKDDWSSTDRDAAVRDGANFNKITVQCKSFREIVDEYGTPYYLKIDIEGGDSSILNHVRELDDKPEYISFEISLRSLSSGIKDLINLQETGYLQFKIRNQGLNRHLKCPKPPLEGKYVKQKFNGLTSGLFGRETQGKWLPLDETIKSYIDIVNEQSKHGMHGTLYHTRYSELYRKFKKKIRRTVGWYDIHAKLSSW
jgi:FkbM family methyltransferase